MDRLRVTAVEGLSPVDPQQAQVPENWRQQPAFRIEAGETFSITERSRGIVATDNELALNRTMWLDFEGERLCRQGLCGWPHAQRLAP